MKSVMKFAVLSVFLAGALGATGCCCCKKKAAATAAAPSVCTGQDACSARLEADRKEAAWQAQVLRVDAANEAAAARASQTGCDEAARREAACRAAAARKSCH